MRLGIQWPGADMKKRRLFPWRENLIKKSGKGRSFSVCVTGFRKSPQQNPAAVAEFTRQRQGGQGTVDAVERFACFLQKENFIPGVNFIRRSQSMDQQRQISAGQDSAGLPRGSEPTDDVPADGGESPGRHL